MRNRKDYSGQSRRGGSARNDGPALLTLRPDSTAGVLRPFTPDFLKEELEKGFGRYLTGCARNLARQQGLTIRPRTPRSTAEATRLIERMKKISGRDIKLYRDNDSTLHLSISSYAPMEYGLYFIPLIDVDNIRDNNLRTLLYRFINTLMERTGIPRITDTYQYEYVIDGMQCELENEDDEDADKAYYEYIKEILHIYDDHDGAAHIAFRRLKEYPTLQRCDIVAFQPKSQQQQELKKEMLSLLDIPKMDLHEYTNMNPTNIFNTTEDCDNIITIDSRICVAYDNDDVYFNDQWTQALNSQLEYGDAVEEEFIVESEITPTSPRPGGLEHITSLLSHLPQFIYCLYKCNEEDSLKSISKAS